MGNSSPLHVNKVTSQGINLFVKYPSRRYFDEFLELRCAVDLMLNKLFPNSKEITESMTAFNAVRRFLRLERHGGTKMLADPNVTMFDVACGSTPRTAAMFACRTTWSTVAIDPVLRENSAGTIQRVQTISKKIEDVSFDVDTAIVTAVHAHVSLEKIRSSIKARRMLLVAMPCCKPLELSAQPYIEYDDWGCWSPKRTVKVYAFGWNK